MERIFILRNYYKVMKNYENNEENYVNVLFSRKFMVDRILQQYRKTFSYQSENNVGPHVDYCVN